MKPFKHVTIKHFQGIEHMQIELDPGINVFTGPTDSGKSSIFRAIEGWSFNEIGEGFVQAGAKFLSVEIDGIRWEKSDKVNRYIIGKEIYDKVGRGNVPEDVREITRIREVEFGDGVTARLNFAPQFGPEFMVGFRGSENAKIVGSLSGIHNVFNALRDATADHKRARTESGRLEKEIEGAEEMVESQVWIQEIAKRMTTLGSLITEAEETEGRVEQLRQYVMDIASAVACLKGSQGRVEELRPLAELDFESYDQALQRRDTLSGLAERYDEARETLGTAENRVLELQNAPVVDFDAYDALGERLDFLKGLEAKYEKSEQALGDAEDAVTLSVDVMNLRTKDFNEAIEGMDLCPVTGGPMLAECKEALK